VLEVALVGSANRDLRSFRLNFEVHAVMRDEITAAELLRCFDRDLSVSASIDLVSFRRRPWPLKVVEGAARLLSPLM
jgi:cardiolipin synthase A/B